MKTARLVLGLAAMVIGVTGCSDSAVAPTAVPPVPVLTASPVAASNGQTALRGTALAIPLQVKVLSDGAPCAGVRVTWQPSAGSIQITSSLTNDAGIASATWVLGTVPGVMTVAATIDGVTGPPVAFTATALPLVTLAADAATDGQTSVVGTTLAKPLRVKVLSEGAQAPGVTVSWQASGISLSPTSSITDAGGFAWTTATLGTQTGVKPVSAMVPGAAGSPVTFTATALAGPAVIIRKEAGDSQTVAANLPAFDYLGVVVTDQYGNPVMVPSLTWTVESGPLIISNISGGSDEYGFAAALAKPDGTPGEGVVRAALPGGQASVDFTLTAGPPVLLVRLDTNGGYGFVSAQNDTRPAVDTIPAGATMTWIIQPFDYEQHGVVPVGTPSFSGGSDFPYASPLTVTFTTPGTYQYTDPYFGITGTIVVQ